MTKKNNVKESAKTKTPLHSDSTADQRTKRKTKNKLRLHSKLKVNVPLSQSLMLILPSLAKHVSASPQEHDVQDTPNDVIDSEEQHSQEDMNLSAEEHPKSDIIENIAPSDKAKAEDANSEQSQNSTLTPSHHLSSLSHPQVHYVPAVSIPTISSGQVPQPTTHTPVTPDLPATFLPEVISGKYGELHVDANGHYTFVLNPLSPQYVLLHQNQPGTDQFMLHLSNGSQLVVQIPVAGKQDIPTISGDLRGVVIEDHNVDSHGLLSASGKIDVVDPDHDQSSVTAETITGQYGSLSIDANGKWHYQVDNSLSNVQALTSLTSLHESFTIHTKDGTPQTIEMTIGGNDDNAIVSGVDAGAVTEESQLQTSGTLTVTDVDTGEAHFSNADITGALGTLHLTDTGGWTYDLDNANPNVQALSKGATATDTITVHSADGTPHQVTITVNGTNDKAVIGGTNAGAVTEESQLHVSGTLTVTDVDTGQAHFSNTDIVGSLGTLHLTDTGGWTYDLDNTNSTVQALGKGATATDTITVHSADGTPHQVTITVNGTNDKAVIGGTSSGSVTEESQLQTSGTLTVTDVDTGEAHFLNSDIVGTLGTLHLTDSGKWTYDLDNTNPTVQALGKGATATDTITVHSADGTPHQVTITINGTDDKAVIGGTNTGAVTEESQLHTSGTLTVTDADTGEAHFSNTDITGALGTLHLTDSGKWTYDLDNANPNVQALSKGATATDTITVHSADGTPHQVTITVNGTNDRAVIVGTNTGAVTEESQLHVNGALTVTDVDTGEAHFSNTDITGALGTLHLTDSGKWTYDLDNTNSTVQALSKGATATDTITVQSADGTPHQVTITVNGTNDKAVIGGTSSGAVTEESQLQTSGTLTVTDVDTGEAHFSNTDIVGSFGTLHLTDSGSWTYDLDNTNPTVQALGKGAAATDTITVHSADGTPHQVTITINGTDDKAVIGGTNTGAVTEESQLQTSGTLTVTDVDTGEAHFSNTDITGALGTLHLTDAGGWTYDLDNTNPTVQALSKGATATDNITVQSADGTPHQVSITVNGTNDKAVIAGTDSGAVTEESQLQTSGTLTVTDVDTGEAHFSNTDITGTLGTLHLQDNGAWTYDLDNTNPTVQALSKGATTTDTITVQSADGTTHQITITVNGTNDKAVIAGTDSGPVTEESQLQTSGTLTVTDVDTGEAHFSNTNIVGTLGTLHLTDNGSWTYDLDNNNPKVQALGQGKTATDTITVQSADGTPHQVTITVNGTNDKAVIAGTDSGAVTEESQLQTSGTLTVTDVDTGEAHFSNTDITGTLGTLHLSDSGKWTYDLDNSNSTVQALGKGATATDTIAVQSADGTTHQVTITVNDTNDKAVIGGTSTGAVTEESQLQTSGTLTVTDVDTGEAHFSNTDITGTLGTLHLTDSGSWTYDLDNTNPTVQALSKGATATDTITVQSADGTTHQVSITVNGTNDKAVIAGTDSGAVTEESQLQTSGTLTVTDVDTGEAHFSNTDITGTLGTLHLQDNGAWTYDLDNTNPTVQALSKGATATDTITVQSADGTPHKVTITVNGTNDSATVSSATVSVDETNVAISTSGTLTSTDVDNPHNAFSANTISGTNGDFAIDASGHWTFTANGAFNHLNVGDNITETFNVTSVDGTPSTVTVTINGTNDRPTVAGSHFGQSNEDTTHHFSVTDFGFTDIDDGDTLHSVTVSALPDIAKGHFELDGHNIAAGTVVQASDITKLTFVPAKDYNGDVQFGFTVNDGHLDSTPKVGSLTIDPVRDSAIITETSTGNVTEDGSHSRVNVGVTTELANGHLQVVDPDSGENKFQYSQFGETAVHDPFGGMLRIDSAGSWGYSVDNSKLQYLAEGQTETVVYRVHSFDGTAYELHIDVVGTNDAPTVTQVALSNGTEDTHYQMQANQFGFTDIDHGDTLHAITITDLPPATQGKFLLDGHDIVAGQHITTANISKLQFIPAPDFNGDVQFKYTVNDGNVDSTEATGTLNLSAVNDGPTVINSIVDAGATAENTDMTFTETQLLALVHATDVDTGDRLSVSDVNIDPAIGSFTKTPAGDWLFHPVTHVNATDAPCTISVTDGHVTKSVDATASLNITAVTDPAVITLTPSTEHHVVTFEPGTPGFVISDGVLPSGPLMKQVSFEVTMIGSGKPAPIHGDPTLMSYSIKGDDNALLLTNPHSLAVWIHGTKFDTHVDANDGHDHRITVSWNADTGSLKLFDNGQVAYSSLDQIPPVEVAKSSSLATGGVLAFGEDQDAVNPGVNAAHGFHTGDGDSFSGTIFQGSMAKTIIPDADVAKGLLGQMLHGHPELLTHFIMGAGGALTDTTGNYQYGIGGNAHTESMEVSLGAQPPESGSTIKFNADIHATDPQDKITSVLVSGLPKDTVLSDGHGHSHISTGFGDKVDVTAWDKTDLQAAFDHRFNNNAYVSVEATTHSPAGDKVVTAVMTVPFKPADVSTDVAVSVDATHGNEDGSIDLLVHAVDIQQPNANIDVVISHLPAGSVLSAGTHDGSGNWHLTTAQLIGLQITPPKDFNGGIDPHVVATSTRIDGSHESANADGRVNVVAVADSAMFSGDDKSTEIHEDNSNHLYASGQVIHSNQHQIIVNDPDAGENFIVSTGKTTTNAQASDHGQWVKGDGGVGEFIVNANGTWDYRIDNTNTALQSLKSGDKYTDTITIQSKDGTSHTLTVEVAGTDDKPTIIVGATQTVTEDGIATATGIIATTDVDTGDSATMTAITDQAGTYGHLTMATNGQWTYTLDNNSAQVQGLTQGQVETDTFTVTSTSTDGSTTTEQLVINVTGTNDAPILNVQEQSFNDDNHQSIDITLPSNLFVDPEGNAITYSLQMVSASGTSGLPNWLTFDSSTLKLTGTPPAEVSGDFDIRVTATDTHGASNHEDFHIAVQQLEGDVKEDGRAQNHKLDATGQLDAYHNGQHIVWHMKADGSDSLNHADGQYGHLSVSTGGTWHYVIDHDGSAHYANSDLNALRGGQVVPESFTLYGYQNGKLIKTEAISIQVEGTNDAPTITGISALSTDEKSIVSGKLDITDVDTGEAFFTSQTITSTHGEFIIEKDGNWHFTPNQAAQSLTSADTVVDKVEISSVDGTKHSLSVTVNGLDTPADPHPFKVTGLTHDTGSNHHDYITSDGCFILHGTGFPGAKVYTMNMEGTVQPDGTWTVDASMLDHPDGTYAIKVFQSGGPNGFDTITQKITVETDLPTISINPISTDDWIDAQENHSELIISGSTSNVVDGNEIEITLNNQNYTATVQSGHWQLTVPSQDVTNIPDNAYQVHAELISLANANTATQDRNIIVSADMTTLHITEQVTEDTDIVANGQIFAHGATFTVTNTGQMQGNYGVLTIQPDGSYHYQLDNQNPIIQALSGTEQHSDNFYISYQDQHGALRHAVLDVGVHGTNDAPLLTGTFEITRDINPGSMTGTHSFGYIGVSDADSGEKLVAEYIGQDGQSHSIDLQSPGGTNIPVQGLGYFNIDANGKWNFTLSGSGAIRSRVDHEVMSGKVHTESVQVSLTDSAGVTRHETLTVHISGDATTPTILGSSQSVMTEDKVMTSTGLLDLLVGSVKVPAGVSWQVTPGTAPIYGDFSIDTNGQWHYTAHANDQSIQHLAEGERLDESITLIATDSKGNHASVDVNLAIVGTNDTPSITHQNTVSVVEDHLLTLTQSQLLANVEDLDSKDHLSVNNIQLVSGGTIKAEGDHWVIQPDADFDGNLQINYNVNDGHVDIANSIAVTVTPDADTPSLFFTKHVNEQSAHLSSPDISGLVDSDLALNIHVGSPDSSETLTVEISGVPSGIQLSAGTENNGVWTLTENELTNLKLTPPSNYIGDFNIDVKAVSHDGASTSEVSQQIGVHVTSLPAPPVQQNDEPEPIVETADITIQVFEDDIDQTQPAAGASLYLQALGIESTEHSQSVLSSQNTPPNDMDLVFAQDDSHAHQETGMDEDVADALAHQSDDHLQDDAHNDSDGLTDVDQNY